MIMSETALGLMTFHFKASALESLGLPNIGYPVPSKYIPELAASSGDLPYELLLFWLQNHTAEPGVDWLQYEPAMIALLELITTDDHRTNVTAETEEWCLDIGLVSLDSEVVTIQRDGRLIAAICSRAAVS